ncbi:RING-type E3 ubiquitin transferase [Ranunculus cassubicifolius]
MNHLVQGNYVGQPFQQTTWVEQQFGNTGNEGSTSSWSYSPAIPYLNGGSVNGVPSDVPSMGGQGYSDN